MFTAAGPEFLPSSLLPQNAKDLRNSNLAGCFVLIWSSASHVEKKKLPYCAAVGDQGAAKNCPTNDGWREMHDNDLHDWHSAANIIKGII